MKSPGKMNFFVSEAINHSLEKSSQHRVFTGKLFSKLVQGRHVSEAKFMEGWVLNVVGLTQLSLLFLHPSSLSLSLSLSFSLSLFLSHSLNEVLEFAEDIAIDIPKIWDYLGEILSPIISQSTLSLSFLGSIYPSLVCLVRKKKTWAYHFDTNANSA